MELTPQHHQPEAQPLYGAMAGPQLYKPASAEGYGGGQAAQHPAQQDWPAVHPAGVSRAEGHSGQYPHQQAAGNGLAIAGSSVQKNSNGGLDGRHISSPANVSQKPGG